MPKLSYGNKINLCNDRKSGMTISSLCSIKFNYGCDSMKI